MSLRDDLAAALDTLGGNISYTGAEIADRAVMPIVERELAAVREIVRNSHVYHRCPGTCALCEWLGL